MLPVLEQRGPVVVVVPFFLLRWLYIIYTEELYKEKKMNEPVIRPNAFNFNWIQSISNVLGTYELWIVCTLAATLQIHPPRLSVHVHKALCVAHVSLYKYVQLISFFSRSPLAPVFDIRHHHHHQLPLNRHCWHWLEIEFRVICSETSVHRMSRDQKVEVNSLDLCVRRARARFYYIQCVHW